MSEETKVPQDEEGFEEYTPDADGNSDDDWELDPDIDQAYEAAEEAKFQNAPPGTYNVVVDAVDRRVSQAGSKMLAWTLKVLDGEQQGRNLFKNHVFSSVESLPYIKADFSLCKITLSPPLTNSILENLPNLSGIMLKVRVVKQKGEYDGVNVYFKEYIGRMTEGTDSVDTDLSKY